MRRNFSKPSLILFALVAASLVSCSLPKKVPKYAGGPLARTFYKNYDSVWKAAQLSIAQYPLKSYDNESGTIETEYISGASAWFPPHKKKYTSGGYRYKINIRLLKSKKIKKNKVKVIVLKQAEKKADFFSNFEKIRSDGLEELSILYRIQRELKIDSKLNN